jgi:hypothetical protein
MQRGLFRYDVTACETKVLICFSIIILLLFSSGYVLVYIIAGGRSEEHTS